MKGLKCSKKKALMTPDFLKNEWIPPKHFPLIIQFFIMIPYIYIFIFFSLQFIYFTFIFVNIILVSLVAIGRSLDKAR